MSVLLLHPKKMSSRVSAESNYRDDFLIKKLLHPQDAQEEGQAHHSFEVFVRHVTSNLPLMLESAPSKNEERVCVNQLYVNFFCPK